MGFSSVELQPVHLPQSDPDIPLPGSNRLTIDGDLVTDTMFSLDHADDPMQVAQCRSCAYTWCADGNAVVARRVGEAVVWMAPMERGGGTGCKDRFAPLPLVDREPIWFAMSEYLKLPDASRESVRPLTPTEGAWLLRCAMRPLLGANRQAPPTAAEFEESLLFRSVEPEGHLLEQRLLDAVARARTSADLREVRAEMPTPTCRLIEGLDLPAYPTPTRAIVVVSHEGGADIWWHVGRGCWARMEDGERREHEQR